MGKPLSSRVKFSWVAILYFAEGFPLGLFFDAFPVYFRMRGLSLAEIGLFNLARLPWTLKFLWAPAVDVWGRRRSWILTCQLLLAVNLSLFVFLEPAQAGVALWALLLTLAVLSATQDIAIDAYSIELLDEKEMGPAVGVRVSAYRIALICAGGVFVALAGLIEWRGAFLLAIALLVLLASLSSLAPETLHVRLERESWMRTLQYAVLAPFSRFWQRPGVVYVLLFVLTFKLGDVALGPMVRPFWVDRHFSPVQIGVIPGTVGVVSTILGTLLGGKLTKSWGTFRALWMLGIAQAVSNLAYAVTAALPPADSLMYSASVIESFCGGLGTAPFLTFLMSVCDKDKAATQYALLSALFALPGPLVGPLSGWVTQHLGYALYFTATFFLSWPAFFLLPWVKAWVEKSKPQKQEERPLLAKG